MLVEGFIMLLFFLSRLSLLEIKIMLKESNKGWTTTLNVGNPYNKVSFGLYDISSDWNNRVILHDKAEVFVDDL
jgi:hypothetical protein